MTIIDDQRPDPTIPIPMASPNTLVLLGAGASVDTGLPSSEALQKNLSRDLPPLYRHLSDIIFPTGDEVGDPERVFRALAFLHAIETEGRPADRRDVVEPLEIARLVGSWHTDIAEYLASETNTVTGSATGHVIDALWDALRVNLWLPPSIPPPGPDLSYLRDLLSAMRGQTVVTLNYDNALDYVRQFAVAFGFDDGPIGQDWNVPTPGPLRSATVRLIRLHGALSWRRDRVTGEVRSATYDELNALGSMGYKSWNGDTPGIIFGAGNKLRPDGPYLDLYAEFKAELASARQLVIIGYSFRDPHVNEALRRWFVSAEPTSVLRVNWLGDELPSVVQQWGSRDDVSVQLIRGAAKDRMRELLAPKPRLASE